MCVRLLRQQLQELRLKEEQRERDQKGAKRRRDLQGETAGERVKPRPGPTQHAGTECYDDAQLVRPHDHVIKDAVQTRNHKREPNSL